jgi:hypothetical protein
MDWIDLSLDMLPFPAAFLFLREPSAINLLAGVFSRAWKERLHNYVNF